jgi:hypothetical protein
MVMVRKLFQGKAKGVTIPKEFDFEQLVFFIIYRMFGDTFFIRYDNAMAAALSMQLGEEGFSYGVPILF